MEDSGITVVTSTENGTVTVVIGLGYVEIDKDSERELIEVLGYEDNERNVCLFDPSNYVAARSRLIEQITKNCIVKTKPNYYFQNKPRKCKKERTTNRKE